MTVYKVVRCIVQYGRRQLVNCAWDNDLFLLTKCIFISRSTDRPTGDVSDRDLSIDTLAAGHSDRSICMTVYKVVRCIVLYGVSCRAVDRTTIHY